MTIQQKQSKPQLGFTVIELLIATAIFSVILLICAAALVQVGRVYTKGITTSRTQETAISIMDDVSQALQFSGGAFSPINTPQNPYRFCINDHRYNFKIGYQLTDDTSPSSFQANHVLYKDINASCDAAFTNLSSSPAPQELLSPGMRLAKLDITQIPSTTRLYSITVRVVYGDNDLLCSPTVDDCNNSNDNFTSYSVNGVPADLSCKSTAGSQFCAVSELSTTVQKRIK
ncbi:MAG TPA: prepilin-type N-terminal cleavage/methylation domain-containing protein [Patescibacteria group bacterium]|nr:prepilin-type N-terminal cleavage/methylation domain-containing protein [Patescibacteria group bacterium]